MNLSELSNLTEKIISSDKTKFNQASARYLRPLGYAVHPRYGAKAPSRNGNSSTS
ncbi:MAG: hypothetical protein FWH31_02145 [Streptococcaceae bacterium]|nr:hypothetical protein [Streptococcaceae bacterium]